MESLGSRSVLSGTIKKAMLAVPVQVFRLRFGDTGCWRQPGGVPAAAKAKANGAADRARTGHSRALYHELPTAATP